jgi:hypothetical protein
MVRANGIVVGSLVLLAMLTQTNAAAAQQFSCNGQVIQGATTPNFQPKPINLKVTLDKNKLSLAMGDGKTVASRVSSNNKIQLKFDTKEFTGEYFHYTGDLFLIYKSGLLARLTCTPA